MPLSGSDFTIPPQFSGQVRLFPLPNLVLFPGVVQALHIFEPRYREMTTDALSGDQLISMALYQNQPFKDLESASKKSPIFQTVCVSKIVASKELYDGRFNLLVVGVKRASIIREMTSDKPYRIAQVELLNDEMPNDSQLLGSLRNDLFETCRATNLVNQLTNHLDIKNIVETRLPLGLLVDLISFLSQLNCEKRQLILELPDVERRCRTLITMLQEDYTTTDNPLPDEFPPQFSQN